MNRKEIMAKETKEEIRQLYAKWEEITNNNVKEICDNISRDIGSGKVDKEINERMQNSLKWWEKILDRIIS